MKLVSDTLSSVCVRARAGACWAWKLWHALLLLQCTVKIWILSYRKFCIIFTSIPCSFSLKREQTSIRAHWTRFMWFCPTFCLRNACYLSIQNLLSSRLPSTNIKIKIYRTTIILLFVLYRCEAWYLTLREKNVGCLGIGCWGRCLDGRGRNSRLEKRGASGFVLFTKYYSGDQITEDEMGGACGTYGWEQKGMGNFGKETWRKARRKVLKCFLRK